MNTLAYLFTVEFLVDNIYDSFINNICKLKFLLKGLECYKGNEMRAVNITAKQLPAKRCACKLPASCLLTEHASADVIVLFIVL